MGVNLSTTMKLDKLLDFETSIGEMEVSLMIGKQLNPIE